MSSRPRTKTAGWCAALLVAWVCTVARTASAAKAPGPKLTACVLGKEQPDAEIGRYQADGAYVLSGTGRDAVDSAEQGSFAGVPTEASNFTFIARVAGIFPLEQFPVPQQNSWVDLSARTT